MAIQPLYAGVIKEAIATKDLKKMKAVAAKAKQYIRDQKDLGGSLLDLLDAIEKLETK
jgi:hypothetical protein